MEHPSLHTGCSTAANREENQLPVSYTTGKNLRFKIQIDSTRKHRFYDFTYGWLQKHSPALTTHPPQAATEYCTRSQRLSKSLLKYTRGHVTGEHQHNGLRLCRDHPNNQMQHLLERSHTRRENQMRERSEVHLRVITKRSSHDTKFSNTFGVPPTNPTPNTSTQE